MKVDHFTKEILAYELANTRFSLAVDLGCGFGDYADILKQHVEYLIGVDRSLERLKVALANGYDEVVCDDINTFEVPWNTDIVFMFYIIEHIPLKDGLNLLNRLSNYSIILTTDTRSAPSPTNHHSLWSEQLLQSIGFRTGLYSRALLQDVVWGRSIFAFRAP